MDNRKKKKNKQNPNRNTNAKTEVQKTEEEKADHAKAAQKNVAANTESRKADIPKSVTLQKKEETATQGMTEPDDIKSSENRKESRQKETRDKEYRDKEIKDKEIKDKEDNTKKENSQKQISKIDQAVKENNKESIKKDEPRTKTPVKDLSSGHMKGTAMNAAKILLPVAACAIIIAVIISYIGSKKSQTVDNPSINMTDSPSTASMATLSDEPLAENAHTNVNELMQSFCSAMADGDMDTVKTIKDYNTDKEIITYKEKSAFIERYDNINCYTKPGIEENSYFVYVTYDVKFKDIETKAPGLNAFYVYTSEDGELKIDGDTEENIKAAFKLVTSQDDVVDLYNRINVSYNEATASDEALNQFMEELPSTIRTSVGVALAQLETQGENREAAQPQTEASSAETGEAQSTEVSGGNEEPLQNQVVNEIVRTTDTVNVRSSDSEEADKIGKAQAGTELKRVEDRINGWSKVIFEDKEAYIKSDYLEVVATEVTTEPTGTVMATTNVNVRSQASQESERIGSAQAGTSYNLLEDQGEWYKIDYNGKTGFVKAEFFVNN